MKKFILLFAILLASCNAPVEEPTGSGYWAGGDGNEKFVNASDELTDIYTKWVQAHNDKDIEAVLSYQTDTIRIALANGNVINGAKEHAEGLAIILQVIRIGIFTGLYHIKEFLRVKSGLLLVNMLLVQIVMESKQQPKG